MKEYLVTWVIEIDADDPRQAAAMAKEIQEDPDSTATIFNVKDKKTGKEVSVEPGADGVWRIL